MLAEQLRKSVLQAAIQGKLTEQLPEDGDARDLLKEIQKEKERLIKEGRIKKEKPLPEITGDEIPFDIPENWCWVRLGELSEFINGDRSSSYPKTTDYIDDGIPFFGATDMIEGKLSYKEVRFISKNKFATLRSGKLKNQDMVCLLRGSIGKIAKFEENAKYNTGFINAQMVIVRFFNKYCINYLEQILNSDYFNKFINGVYTGTAVKQLPAETLRQLIIPLPPLTEQYRIFERLYEIIKKIKMLEKDEQILNDLQKQFPKKMKNSILQYAIQGKITEQLESDGDARDLLKEIQKEKTRLIKEGKIKKEKPLPEISEDEIPFDIPDNWCWVRLGEIGVWAAGATPDRSNSKYFNKGTIPWLKTGDLNDGLIEKIPEYINELALQKTSVKLQPEGTVLIAMYGATIGKIGILNLKATTNQACCGCIAYNGIYNWYLFYYLMSHKNEFINQGAGGAQPNISREKIIKTIMPLPPLAEQHRIVERLDQLLPLCDELE